MQYESVRISEGLRREELILQIADRLNLINSYSNSIFKSISERLNDVQHQLKDINHRSEICSKKIELLKSEKKAITLYSNAKFPKKPSRKSTEFIGTIRIDAEDLIRLKRFDKTHPIIESSHVPYDDDCKLKSQFYIYDDGSKKYQCMVNNNFSSFILYSFFLYFRVVRYQNILPNRIFHGKACLALARCCFSTLLKTLIRFIGQISRKMTIQK